MKFRIFILFALILITSACTSVEVGQIMTLEQGAVLREDVNSFAGVGNYSQGCTLDKDTEVIIDGLDEDDTNYGSSHDVLFVLVRALEGDFSCENQVEFQTYWVSAEHLQ